MADQVRDNSTDILQTLDYKKQALQELIQVAQTIERLQQGLQAVLLMGGNVQHIPRDVLRFYRGLDARLRAQPVRELSQLSNRLERAIRNDVGQILQLAAVEDSALLERHDQVVQAEGAADALRLAEDFRRRVQTAVFLRVLLREHGVVTEPLEFTVPVQQIRQQIALLDERGRRYRVKAQREMHAVLKELQQCLVSETVPEALKETLRTVQRELRENLKHLQSGRPIEEMPFAVEYHFLQEETLPASPQSFAEIEARRDDQEAQVTELKSPPGLLHCLWLWCVTPTSVSWSMLRTGRYRPSGKN